MSVLKGLGNQVSYNAKAYIAIMLVLTLIFSYFGIGFVNVADHEAFNPDHELIRASEEVGDMFGMRQYSVMVLVRAKDKDLLDIDDMKELIRLETDLRQDEVVSKSLVSTSSNPTGIMSVADMLVMSYGLLQSRAGMDQMLMGMNTSLNELVPTLQDPMVPNQTKAMALMMALTYLSENMTAMEGGNGGSMPSFNGTISLMTLDAIAMQYGPDPVPSFIQVLAQYDVAGASLQTNAVVGSLNSTITSLMPYVSLLQGMPLGPTDASMILMGLQYALPAMTVGAGSLDKAILGMYFGLSMTLSKDFQKSGGVKAKGTLMTLSFYVDMSNDERLNLENAIKKVSKDQDGDLEYGVLGMQLISEEIQESMDFSQMFLLVLVVILIVVILTVTFRSLFDTGLTMLCLGMAIMWSYGISIMIGLQGSMIGQVVPILLVGLGVDYGIHMTMRFREEKARGRRNKKAIAITIATVGMALLLATITTSIGFMSNTVSSLSILRDFAIMVTIGIISSFVIMTTFQPAVKLVVTEWKERSKRDKGRKASRPKPKRKASGRAVPLVVFGARAADKAPGAVLLVVLLISAAAGYGASMLDTVFNFNDFLPEGTEAHDQITYLMDEFKFGDEEYCEIYIKGDMTSPEVLVAIDETISNTQDDEQVVPGIGARSILSVLQKYGNPSSTSELNRSYVENWTMADPDGDGIPDRDIRTLYDILWAFPTSHPELIGVLHRNEAGDYDATLVRIRVTSDNLRKAGVLREELNKDAGPLKRLVDDDILDNVYVIGEPIVTDVVIGEMNQGQINSIIITIIASTIVLTIVFLILERSLILGLLTSIPIMLVILWILGSMYLLGYSLNVMTITIASLTVGMGITYSIHITERFTEDIKRFKDVSKACENTLTHTGMALAGAFMTTAGGFGILFFHKLPPLQQFGVLIALSITYSFLASVYILPTFLILWAKWRRKREEGPVKKKKAKKGRRKGK